MIEGVERNLAGKRWGNCGRMIKRRIEKCNDTEQAGGEDEKWAAYGEIGEKMRKFVNVSY